MNPTMKIFELKKFKILIACVIISAVFSACENDMEKVKIISGKKAMPAETGKDVEILYSDSAKLKARLLATELNRFVQKPPYIEMPKGIKLYFYDSNQKVNSTLTAQYAKVLQFPDNNIMEARRKVVVVNEKNEKLETEHLIWNQKEETIVSNAYVTITTKDEIIMGDGLESNQSFTKYKIKKMKGTINLKN
jgi:LPS export ABC transporter protein LptC